MPRKFTGYIDENDCIGDSLGTAGITGQPKSTINQNSLNLDEEVQKLRTDLASASSTVTQNLSSFNITDSTTIDLSWNNVTRTLSADVRPDSIRYSQLASWQSLSASPTLSAEAVQPRLAKAWGSFNVYGIPSFNGYDNFNVLSVADTSTRQKTITFKTPLPNNKYVGILTAMCQSGETGYIGIEPMIEENQTTTQFIVNHYDEIARDYTRISFVIFGY